MRIPLMAAAATACAFSFAANASEIDDCTDGQTCILRTADYEGPVHLFCVEARPRTDPVGKQAWLALRNNVEGTIQVLIDGFDGRRQPIAELIRGDGLNLGLDLIQQGLARVPTNGCDEPEYLAAEAEAKRRRVGIWASQ